MEYVQHGGQCCGISHVHGFDYTTEASLDQVLLQHDQRSDHGTPGSRTLEAVLSERQVNPAHGHGRTMIPEAIWQEGGWAPVLFRKGFRLVGRFRNSNSNEFCYIFHRNLAWSDLPAAQLPFDTATLNLAPVMRPVTAPAPTPVKVLYGVRPTTALDSPPSPVRYFETEEALNNHWPRARNKFKMTFYSNGTIAEENL